MEIIPHCEDLKSEFGKIPTKKKFNCFKFFFYIGGRKIESECDVGGC